MRYVRLFLFLLVVSFLMGSGTKESTFTKGIKKGCLAPEVNLQGVDLKDGDEYVLLQFWAAYDAESRKQNALLTNKISRLDLEHFKMISISFDETKSVYEQAIQADLSDVSSQFNDTRGKYSEIYEQFRIENGFGNWLIDPQGVIIGRNLTTVDEVVRILREQKVS